MELALNFSAFLLLGLAKVGITRTVQIGDCFLPLSLQPPEQWRWDGDKGASSVYHCGIATSLTDLRQPIEQGLPSECPRFDVRENIRVVPEGLEARGPADNLLFINATEDSEAIRIAETQAKRGATYQALVHQGPNEVLVTSVCAHLGGEPKDGVRPRVKAFSFGETQELEVHAVLVLLHARAVLRRLALELGRAIDDGGSVI